MKERNPFVNPRDKVEAQSHGGSYLPFAPIQGLIISILWSILAYHPWRERCGMSKH